jgi:DNA-binding XRE family transcriptional regulator
MEIKIRKRGRPKKYKSKLTRLSITEMAKRLGLSRQALYLKNKTGLTVYDMHKILQKDFPEIKIRDVYTCPFLTPGKKLMRLNNATLGVRTDGKVVLLKEEKIESTRKKRCVLCGIREGEESMSPRTNAGFHLAGHSCVMVEPNSWICYECCKGCPEFDYCQDEHGF